MILTIPQTTALDYLEDRTTNEVLFGGSAGPGKSTLGCYWQLKQRMKHPGTRGLIGRSTLKTLRDTTLKTFYETAKKQGFEPGYHFKKVSLVGSDTVMTFRNGSEILWKQLFYKPSDQDVDDLGSLELTDAFVDEASQIHATVKNVLKSRIRFMLDPFNLVPKVLYATNPGRNWTKTEFRDPALANALTRKKRYVPALLDSNEYISKFYGENLQTLPKNLRDRLLYGNWEYGDDPSQLMTLAAINAIFTNSFVKPDGKKFITADIARMGEAKVVIRVWHGWRVLQRVVFTKIRIDETAEKIKALANEHGIPMSQVMCDEDGVGGGVVDILRCKGFVANARPNEAYKNRNNKNFATAKDQCGWYLADRVRDNEVYEYMSDENEKKMLIEELEHIKDAGLNKDEKNKLVSKDKISAEIGRSPDDSDTYLMRAWFDLSPVLGGKFFIAKKPVIRR